MNKLAIIYTTFLRDELMKKTILSILNHWNQDYVLFVGDQGNQIEAKTQWLTERGFNQEGKNLYYIPLPFDCGLSLGRNKLLEIIAKEKIDYVLLTADSIEFTDNYNFDSVISFMEEHFRAGIVGLDLKNRVPWEGTIDLKTGEHFYLDVRDGTYFIHEGKKFSKVDICRNFFLAKTQCLLDNPWINPLKLGDHCLWFYNLKKNYVVFKEYNEIYQNWEVYITDYLVANYIEDKPVEYKKYRQRLYNEYIPAILKKLNLKQWIKYSPDMEIVFKIWKENNERD